MPAVCALSAQSKVVVGRIYLSSSVGCPCSEWKSDRLCKISIRHGKDTSRELVCGHGRYSNECPPLARYQPTASSPLNSSLIISVDPGN